MASALIAGNRIDLGRPVSAAAASETTTFDPEPTRQRPHGPGLICLLNADNGICIQLTQWITKLIRRLPLVIRRISRGHLAIFEPSLGSDVRFWPEADGST